MLVAIFVVFILNHCYIYIYIYIIWLATRKVDLVLEPAPTVFKLQLEVGQVSRKKKVTG